MDNEIIKYMLILVCFCTLLGVLSKFLDAKTKEIRGAFLECKILQNVYLPKEKEPDQTTEIDTIMINKKGIFVFEYIRYSGWIFGNEKEMNWTQMLNENQEIKFYNPIKQNNTHIKSLKKILTDKKIQQYYSFVVFIKTQN